MPRSLVGTGQSYQKSTKIEDIVSQKFSETYQNLPVEWFALEEAELIALVKPTPVDWGLRVNFSRLYADFCNPSHPTFKHIKIDNKDIYDRVVSKRYFQEHFLNNPKKVLFITTPLKSMQVVGEMAVMIANNRLMELIGLPIKDTDGKVDTKAASVVLQACREAFNRYQGLPVQRTQNLNVNVDGNTAKEMAEKKDPLSLDDKIAQLQKEIDGVPAIDVEAEDVE